jgi:hypothetical protein
MLLEAVDGLIKFMCDVLMLTVFSFLSIMFVSYVSDKLQDYQEAC